MGLILHQAMTPLKIMGADPGAAPFLHVSISTSSTQRVKTQYLSTLILIMQHHEMCMDRTQSFTLLL